MACERASGLGPFVGTQAGTEREEAGTKASRGAIGARAPAKAPAKGNAISAGGQAPDELPGPAG